MGLNHPVSLYAHAREVDSSQWPWPKPPRISRRWYAAINGDSAAALRWQTETLAESLTAVDLHCQEIEPSVAPELAEPPTKQYAHWSDDDYTASLVLKHWPREAAPYWLGQALSGETPADVAIHFQPRDSKRYARTLKRQQRSQTQELADTGDAAAELGAADARTMRRHVVAGTDRSCRVAIVLTVHAASPDKLSERVQTVIYGVGLKLGDVVPIDLEHDRGRLATEPLGVCDVAGAYKPLDCTGVAYTGIFQPSTIEHVNGIDIGITHGVGTFNKGGQLVRLDPYDDSLEGFSGLVIGKKRMGKSYFLKILARGMARRGVEVTIIEQRRPPEYAVLADEPNIHLVNIEEMATDDDAPDVAVAKRAGYLREFTTRYWNRCRDDPKPRMLIIDEAWALLQHAQSSGWIEEVARTCGHFGLSFWLASQQVREFLDTGEAVLDNTEIVVCLKQMDNDLDRLAHSIGMPHPARSWLRTAVRGQVLIKVGDMWVACDVARVPEHYQITTDPRDRWRALDKLRAEMEDQRDDEGAGGDGNDSGRDRSSDRLVVSGALRDRLSRGGTLAAVDTERQ